MSHQVKARIQWNSLVICIEYFKGEIRFANTDHPVVLTADYGHFYATTSEDGEELDCYIGDNLTSPNIFRISQLNQDGFFDEFKFFIGFNTQDEVIKCFNQNMPAWAFGGIQTSSIDEIKKYSSFQILLQDIFSQWLSEETKKTLGINQVTMGFISSSAKESVKSNAINNLIEISLRAIKDRCDGGHSSDGKGYRPGDSVIVTRLLSKAYAEWNDEEEQKAINLLYRYRKQLKDFGIDYTALVDAIDDEVVEPSKPNNYDLLLSQLETDKINALESEIKKQEDLKNSAKKENVLSSPIAETAIASDSTVASESTATEGFIYSVKEKAENGLPLVVEFEGPAEGKSQNYYVNEKGEKIHREWPFRAFDQGTKNTNKFIEKGVFPRVQLSHPDDDPEETGIFPAGELIALETIPNQKRLKGQVRLFHTTDEGLEVAQRYANKDYPDYSIRTRPTCSDNDLFGQCMINTGVPLLVDFLRKSERPGLPGSKGSRIIERKIDNTTFESLSKDDAKVEEKALENGAKKENFSFRANSATGRQAVEQRESEHPCECKDSENESKHCDECKEKYKKSERITPQKLNNSKENISNRSNKSSNSSNRNNRNRVFENFINNFSVAGTEISNSGDKPNQINKLKSKGVENIMSKQLIKIINEIAKIEDPNIRKATATGYEMAMDTMDMKKKDKKDGEEMDGEDPDDEGDDPGMMEKNSKEKGKGKESFATLVKAVASEVTKQVTETLAKTLPAIKAEKAEEKVVEKPAEKATEATKLTVDRKAVLEALGTDEETWNIQTAKIATEKAKAALESSLRSLHSEAIANKVAFCGHSISDTALYPETAVESAIRAACLESDLATAKGFLKAKLDSIATEAKQVKESVFDPVGILDAEKLANMGLVIKDPSSIKIGENHEIRKKVNEVQETLLNYIKEHDPEGYKRYEYNKNLPTFQRKAEEMLQMCVKEYGANSIMAYNDRKRAKEDAVVTNGFSQMPNYPAVMTAIMQVRQWRKSPVWDLVGNNPQVTMELGQVIRGNGQPMGQFVEIYSEDRSQRRDYDAAFIQSASDPQHEISVESKPHQYFAYQEITRVRWTDELEAFMRMDPLKRDIPARLVFNLMQELDLFTEQRIATTMLRDSDAYKCTTITNETTNIAATDTWNYTGGTSGITLPDGTVVTNGIGWVWMRRGFASGTTTPVYGPIVRPGIDPTLNRATLTFPVTYPVNINAINGVTQYRGMYNSTTQAGVKINYTDPDPTFIVFPDTGICVFLIGSGFDATHMPTFSQYSVVDNVLRFSFTPDSGESVASIGNRYIQAVASLKGTFSQRNVEEGKTFLLTSSPILQNVVSFATHLNGLTQLAFAQIAQQFKQGLGPEVSTLQDTMFLGTTEPLYANNYRALLGLKGLTMYEELMPPVLGGLDQGGILSEDGRIAYTSEKSRSLARRAIVATIPPRIPGTDVPANFGYASLYHSAFPQTSGLPI